MSFHYLLQTYGDISQKLRHTGRYSTYPVDLGAIPRPPGDMKTFHCLFKHQQRGLIFRIYDLRANYRHDGPERASLQVLHAAVLFDGSASTPTRANESSPQCLPTFRLK